MLVNFTISFSSSSFLNSYKSILQQIFDHKRNSIVKIYCYLSVWFTWPWIPWSYTNCSAYCWNRSAVVGSSFLKLDLKKSIRLQMIWHIEITENMRKLNSTDLYCAKGNLVFLERYSQCMLFQGMFLKDFIASVTVFGFCDRHLIEFF